MRKIFLSYTPTAAEFAAQLTQELRSSGHVVFAPHAETYLGDNVLLQIGRALETADAMVPIISSDFGESELCQAEVAFALQSKRFAHRVLPVYVERADSSVPWFLRNLPSLAFSGNVSDIAQRIVPMMS